MIKYINRFFWWCAGARADLLEQSPSDQPKYYGIGGTVFFTAVMATLAGGYAFFIAFDDVSLSVFFGLFWGALIFNLDRYIVSSIGIGDGTAKISWEEFLTASPRLVLAILIAFVVATPLELKVFEKEISVEIQKIIDEKRVELSRGQDYNLDEIQMIKDEIVRLRNEEERLKLLLEADPRISIIQHEIDELKLEEKNIKNRLSRPQRELQQQYNELNEIEKRISDPNILQSERNGYESRKRSIQRGISKNEPIVKRYGRHLRAKQNEITEKEKEITAIQGERSQEYSSTLEINRNKIAKLEQQLANIQEMRRGEIVRHEEVAKQYDGLMAQLDALDRLSYRTVKELKYISIPTIQTESKNDSTGLSSSELSDTGLLAANDIPVKQVVETEHRERTPIWWAKWLITCLFICIEIAPILFKLMTEAGPYDDRIAEEKHISTVMMKKRISEMNQQTNTELTISAQKHQIKMDAEIKANRTLVDEIASAQANIIKSAIEKWHDQQLEKIKENPESIIKVNANGKS